MQKDTIGLAVEKQGHRAIGFEFLPMHTHISHFKGLSKIFLSCHNVI